MGTGMDEEQTRNVVNDLNAIKTKMAIYDVQQSSLELRIDKHDQLLDAIVKQTTEQGYQTKAIIALNEQQTKDAERHSVEIEQIKKEQIDTGKLLASFSTQLKIIGIVGSALVTAIIGYFLTLIVH